MQCVAGNGYITTQTLKDILAQIDDKLTSDDLDGMIEEIDIEGTGRIDVEGWIYIDTPASIVSWFQSGMLDYIYS